MAVGDITWFDQALVNIGNGTIDLASGSIKLGLVDDTITPTASTSDPCWGAGGGTDLSANAVATGTSYTGPITLANKTWGLSGGKAVLDADNVSISQDGSGFTDARFGILFDDSAANKNAIAFVDLGSDRSIQPGPLAINFDASGILTIDQA